MSHGPSIYVFDLNKKQLDEKKEEISNLLLGVDCGTYDEKKYLAEYISNMLFDVKGATKGFAFWNHREGQEIEDYDILCDLFEHYARIISSVCDTEVTVHGEYREYFLLCKDDKCFKLNDDDGEELEDYIENLRLKSDVAKGEVAKKKLKNDVKEGVDAE